MAIDAGVVALAAVYFMLMVKGHREREAPRSCPQQAAGNRSLKLEHPRLVRSTTGHLRTETSERFPETR